MIAPTTMSTRWTRRLAALLLVLQGLTGSAVSLAHASERFTAPIHIEAQHASACIALHDELRCTLCHYAGSLGTSPQVRTQAQVAATVERRPSERDSGALRRPDHHTAPPRAPPASRS